MRVATWNVNSLKARLARLEAWLDEVQPDVCCLQETKLAEVAFPSMAFSTRGYEVAHHGEGRWNGVAICSRVGLDDVIEGFADGGPPEDQARLVSATCDGIRVLSCYVPNGRSLQDPNYQYKLAWLERLEAHVDAQLEAGHDLLVCGDMNIAPTDLDVWDPTALEGSTHVSEPERKALARLEDKGLVDVVRARHPGVERLFTWWDYRAGAFHKGMGMRIDLVLASPRLAQAVSWVLIDRNARKGPQPSDHAPVVVQFERRSQ